MTKIEILQPDDWHIHLRDGDLLPRTVGDVARIFKRAIVMPNLPDPVTTTKKAATYRARILKHRPEGSDFEPLMTIYLTDHTDPSDLIAGFKDGLIKAAKLYPAHATTHSGYGVTSITGLAPVFEEMSRAGMPLLIHGEVTAPGVDIYDREKAFIVQELEPLIQRHPGLKVVFEHITTREAVEFVRNHSPQVGATITPHHLLFNRTDMFRGGLRPHLYCLPILKREHHRQALRQAATSGESCFFLGSDSAPHEISSKESTCGCAGIYNSPVALEAYAQVFEEEGALGKLQGFASEFGPRFYGLPLNSTKIVIQKTPIEVPTDLSFGLGRIVPMLSGETLRWKSLKT